MKSFARHFIIAACIVFCSTPCFSTYLIEFKSGAKFITADYWKEGQKIWFHQSGGFIGIEKHLIKEIRESEFPELIRQAASDRRPFQETDRMREKAPSVPEHPQKAVATQSTSQSPSTTAPLKDDEIEKEFDGLKKRVATAVSLEKTELISLAKDMTAFRNKVLKKNLGHVYTDRLLELIGMFERIEKLINSMG